MRSFNNKHDNNKWCTLTFERAVYIKIFLKYLRTQNYQYTTKHLILSNIIYEKIEKMYI